MKKIAILLIVYTWMIPIRVQAEETKAFSTLGIGLSIGTTGLDVELVTPLHHKIMLRGGITALPFNFSQNMNVYHKGRNVQNGVDINGTFRMINGKFLMDFYPTGSGFFMSGGFYLGNKTVVTFDGRTDRDLIWDDYVIPSENGRIEAEVRTNAFKPYLAIGLGNAIPDGSVGFRVELGAMMHGKPVFYNEHVGNLSKIEVENGDISYTLEKWKVYPVLSFRLTGRFF